MGIHVDAREWHTYEVDWSDVAAAFLVDGQAVFRARIGPRAPLGCVVWIDNQFARFDPQGRLGWGLEACPTEAWLEIADLKTSSRVSPPP